MASMDKHGADTLYFIRHNMRELPPDKTPSNVEIDPERTKDNYSIISRGKTAEEVNDYRKQIESEIFHYNRKNLVRSVEVVITLPTDCPPEQEHTRTAVTMVIRRAAVRRKAARRIEKFMEYTPFENR